MCAVKPSCVCPMMSAGRGGPVARMAASEGAAVPWADPIPAMSLAKSTLASRRGQQQGAGAIMSNEYLGKRVSDLEEMASA